MWPCSRVARRRHTWKSGSKESFGRNVAWNPEWNLLPCTRSACFQQPYSFWFPVSLIGADISSGGFLGDNRCNKDGHIFLTGTKTLTSCPLFTYCCQVTILVLACTFKTILDNAGNPILMLNPLHCALRKGASSSQNCSLSSTIVSPCLNGLLMHF